MTTTPVASRPSAPVRQAAVAALGVGFGAVTATVVVTILESFDGGAADALLSCLHFAAWTALPCAVLVWPLSAVRLCRTRLRTVRERCSSVAVWSCVVPFVWAAGFSAVAGRMDGGPSWQGTAGLAVIAGAIAEMVWLFTLTPVFVYHCTARALRGDPLNGAAVPRLGRDEHDEDTEVGAAA